MMQLIHLNILIKPTLFICSLVTEISQHVKVKANTKEEDDSNFKTFFPDFIWAIRDLTLERELDGKPVTADEYLEHALKRRPGRNFSPACLILILN